MPTNANIENRFASKSGLYHLYAKSKFRPGDSAESRYNFARKPLEIESPLEIELSSELRANAPEFIPTFKMNPNAPEFKPNNKRGGKRTLRKGRKESKKRTESFCKCIKSVRKSLRKVHNEKEKEQRAIAICVTSMLQKRGRTLKKFNCNKKMLETQPPL